MNNPLLQSECWSKYDEWKIFKSDGKCDKYNKNNTNGESTISQPVSAAISLYARVLNIKK